MRETMYILYFILLTLFFVLLYFNNTDIWRLFKKVKDTDKVNIEIYDWNNDGKFYHCRFRSVNGYFWTHFLMFYDISGLSEDVASSPGGLRHYKDCTTLKECKDTNRWQEKRKEDRDKEINENKLTILR